MSHVSASHAFAMIQQYFLADPALYTFLARGISVISGGQSVG